MRTMIRASVLVTLFTAQALTAQTTDEEDYEKARRYADGRQTAIVGFLVPEKTAKAARYVTATNANDVLLNAYKAGQVKLLYSVTSDRPNGEAGREGDFEQRFSTSWDRHGREVGQGSTILPLGLVTTWDRRDVGIDVDILYAERGPLSRVGTQRLPIYLRSEIKGVATRIFDRPQAYFISLPKGARRGERSLGLVIISPTNIPVPEALRKASLGGAYFRAAGS